MNLTILEGYWLLFLASVVSWVSAMRLVAVRVPTMTTRGQSARLECQFELDGEELYSVKWYKDGDEFYRYVPKARPPAQYFKQNGVLVDLRSSTVSTVTLQSVSLASSGTYRCEVSAEAPSFQTVTDHAKMTVVVLPESKPWIEGGRRQYQIGDMVYLNCTSGKSKPAAQLTWYINGKPVVDRTFLRGPYYTVSGREGLQMTSLILEFKLRKKHVNQRSNEIKFRCMASIANENMHIEEHSQLGKFSSHHSYPGDSNSLSRWRTTPSINSVDAYGHSSTGIVVQHGEMVAAGRDSRTSRMLPTRIMSLLIMLMLFFK